MVALNTAEGGLLNGLLLGFECVVRLLLGLVGGGSSVISGWGEGVAESLFRTTTFRLAFFFGLGSSVGDGSA